jgi:putative membrane protein
MLDAVLAWVHFVAIFAFTGCLFAEVLFYAQRLPAVTLARIARIDIAYGILTVAVVVSGIAHVMYSPKTPAFYVHDVLFWTKIGLFLTLGLFSIPPTVHFIRLRRAGSDAAGSLDIDAGTYRTVRACLVCEVILLLCIPLCAAFIARGYGFAG